MVSKVNLYERLRYLTFHYKKVKIAKYLGISRQRLNYYFRTKRVNTRDKSIIRKLNYRFFKLSKFYGSMKGYKKRTLIFKNWNWITKQKIKIYGKLIKAKFIRATVVFIAKNGYYKPTTQNYLFPDKDSLDLFFLDVEMLLNMYNIVTGKTQKELESTEVIFKYIEITYLY